MPPNARAQLALRKFAEKYPSAGTIRISIKNENGRWTSAALDEHAPAGTVYRFQAASGRNVLGFELYEVEPFQAPDAQDDLTFQQDEPARPARKRELENEPAPLNLIERPAPVISDPWLDLFRQRMEKDEQRIQELHQANLRLVDSVSSHHQGATGPLVKLIDQLARGLAKVHADKIEHLDRRQRDLIDRETYVETAEETAESRLIDAEEKQKESQTEGAIIQGVIQHLAPTILETLGKT